MNIAIFSPNQNPYSETFIQAHKNGLNGNIFFYYGNLTNLNLEGYGRVSSSSSFLFKLKYKIFRISREDILINQVVNSIKSNSVDVLLVEYGSFAFKLLPFLKRIEIPVVVHFHGYDASVHKVIEKCNSYKEVFKRVSRVVAVSNKMYERLLEIGCPQSKLVYSTYGPNPIFEEINSSFSNKNMVAVGRFTDKKAPYYTILAFAQLLKKHPDASLHMIGDGVLLPTCKNLVRFLKIQDKVFFVGIKTALEIREILEKSVAFVQHSITAENGDQEGTPLAVFESGLAGLPVISTYHAGIPDIIQDGFNGYLSNEHDVEGMANNMVKLLNSPKSAKLMGSNGRKRIKENFTQKMHLERLDKILTEVLNE